MLDALKFVQGSVAKKDFLPALSHFVIEDGTVRGYNGTIALCSPIPFDIACKPKAESLVKAIAGCETTVTLALTPKGRLSVRSGAFKVFVECAEGDTPHATPEGEFIQLDGAAFLAGVKAVEPFIGDDASRPWTNGVLLRGQSALSTNNIIIAEYWTGVSFPRDVNIPRAAIKELLRINQQPTAVQLADTSITFHFEDGKWLRSQLFESAWPDFVKLLDCQSNPLPIPTEFALGLTTVKHFVDKLGRVWFNGDGVISTAPEGEEGASYVIDGFNHTGIYNVEMLIKLASCAHKVDWTAYPKPCMFFGDRLRGAIVGMKP